MPWVDLRGSCHLVMQANDNSLNKQTKNYRCPVSHLLHDCLKLCVEVLIFKCGLRVYVYQKQLLCRQRYDETGISIHFASLIANDKYNHCQMYKKGGDALSNVAVELFAEKQIPG